MSGVLRHVPARTVEIPALIDGDDLAQLAAAHDLAHLLLIWIAQPLRAHLHHLLARLDRVARQLGVFQRVRHRLFAVAVLAGPHHFRQNPRVLVIAGADHHRVQFLVRQHFLGILEQLGPGAEQPLHIVGRPFAIHRPEIAHAAQIEIRIGLGRQFQHGAMAGRAMAHPDLPDLNAVVRARQSGRKSAPSALKLPRPR